MSALPAAHGFDLAAHPEGAWQVDPDLVVALPCSSVVRDVVRSRMARQDHPLGAMLFVRGKRFFAEVRFRGDNRPSVVFALDMWTPIEPLPKKPWTGGNAP